MIILGTKGKTKVIGKGKFMCPRCGVMRPYSHKEVGKYFSLYFIPLFKVDRGTEFIECEVCKTAFETKVLDLKAKREVNVNALLDKVQKQLESGMPANTVREGLLATGLREETAKNVISMATDGKIKECRECNLLYAESLSFCSRCGGKLSGM